MAKDEALLLKNALASPAIGKSRLLRKLLQYLYENRGTPLNAVDIWNDVLVGDGRCDGQRVRELVYRLRKVLEEIQWVTDSTNYFEIPDADDPDESGDFGYRLAFPQRKARRATEAFWRAHTKADVVRIVYAEPVFFYDIAAESYLRFFDTNPRHSNQEMAVSDLQAKHGGQLKVMFPDGVAERLKPTQDFVGTGEVAAMDRLSDWFLRRSFLRTRRDASDRLSGLGGGCPILLGSMRTNRFIESVLGTEEGDVFNYRLDPLRTGFVNIRENTHDLRGAFKRYKVEEKNGSLSIGQPATLSPVRDRLCVLQRMNMPGEDGFITIISSDTSLAIRQVAMALTDDKQLELLLSCCSWTGAELPSCFEMLLSVRIAPAGVYHEAGMPELITSRVVS